MIINTLKNLFGGISYDKEQRLSHAEAKARTTEVRVNVEVSKAAYDSAKLTPGESVYTLASPLKVMAPADYIASMKIMADKTVELGTMVLYLYKKEGLVKRVFKIRELQVKELLRAKKMRFYLTPLKWDATDTDLNKAKALTNADLERLLTICGKEANPKKAKQKFTEISHKSAVDLSGAPAPQKVSVPKAVQPIPIATELREAVKRNAKGEEQIGVVAEMGMVDRSNGGQPYKSFCLKIDVGGMIKPSYGVELEREARERGVRAGDTIRLIFMGTEPTAMGYKKLYRLEVLKKGASS